MKRIANLWGDVTSFENLLSAWKKAKRGKADRDAVVRFALNLERNLLRLQHQLINHTYRPSGYYLFKIYDRKPRTIAAAPFHDRVVHHALMNPLEPQLDRRLIHDCYACRKGKGVHAAVVRYQRWAQSYSYALKMDVRGYFPNIDHQLMKMKLQRLVKDKSVLWLLDLLIDSAPASHLPAQIFSGDDLVDVMQRPRGLPIGNLTSQLMGNLYLNDLDHFVNQALGCSTYLRYVDDMVLLGNNKKQLWQWSGAINEFLSRERLSLHPDKTQLCRVDEGGGCVGLSRISPPHSLAP